MPPSADAGRATAVRRRRRAYLVVGLVVVLGCAVVVRFLAPGALWLDEAQSVAIARLPLPELLGALRQDGSPPLYYVLLHGWIQVFGEGARAVRALSGVLAVATMPVVWIAARRAAGTSVAWVLLLLVASSPFAIRYASETRMYALVLLLVALGAVALQAVHRRGGIGPVAALTLVTGALLLTHVWALHLVTAVGVGALLALRRHRRSALRVLAGLTGGAVLFLPWVPSFVVQLDHTGSPWATSRGWAVFPVALQAWQGGSAVVAQILGGALVCAATLGTVRGGRGTRRLAGLVLGGLLLAAVVSSLTLSAVSGRYTGMVVLPFLAVAAVGLDRLSVRARVLAVAVLTVGGMAIGAVAATAPRTQADQVASALQNAAAGDVVVFCPDQLGPAVARLAPAGLDLVAFPDLTPADRVDWTDYVVRNDSADPQQVARAVLDRAAGQAVWVVTGSGYVVPSDERCQEMVAAIEAQRGQAVPIVAPWDGAYERDRLDLFAPAP